MVTVKFFLEQQDGDECDHECTIEINDDSHDKNDYPYRGKIVVCDKCGQGREIGYEQPEGDNWGWEIVIESVLLSEIKPHSPRNGYDGSADGTYAQIVFDMSDNTFGYCFNGVSDGNGFESETTLGFDSFEDAVENAKDEYNTPVEDYD